MISLLIILLMPDNHRDYNLLTHRPLIGNAPTRMISKHQRQFVVYGGEVHLKDVHTVLATRNLEFNKAGSMLRFCSLRA
jgi:hypothetical protein